MRKKLRSFFLLCLLGLSLSGLSQVGINTSTPAPGALLDINSSSKGLLIPRIALTSTSNYAPITPSSPETTGLLIYNTATAGTGSIQVTPGFYYWGGSNWRRFFNQGYHLNYTQQSEVRAQTNVRVPIPDLDTGASFQVPFNGTYQIIVSAYYAAGQATSSIDGSAQGAIILEMDSNNSGTFTNVRESYFTSSSKYFGGSTYAHSLAQNVNIIYNVDLDASTNYQFRVTGEQWAVRDVEDGWFGKTTDTTDYPNSTSDNAQRCTMSITLVRQY